MSSSRAIGISLIALAASTCFVSSPAQADALVTYAWTTTSEGFGFNVGEPSSAAFQVPLSDVLNGMIPQSDITNIQLSYPGLTFNSALPSSGGLDASAFVNPITGAFVYHDI